jgi:predicted GNAT superfamily acetyltransferase
VDDPLIRRLDDAVTIRRAEGPADYHACQDAQRRAWGIAEDGYLIPIATMAGANLHGGLVLGAFLDDGRAVGLSFGFLGRVEGRLCLYSQLTGVVPEWQARGLGYEMKQVQREFARASDLPLIAWAFDPLQAGNARFNLGRLGARVRRYVDDMYGPRTDTLNAGVPTDRVIAEWEVTVETGPGPPVGPASLDALPHMIHARDDASGARVPVAVDEQAAADQVLVEIPARIADLRREQPDAAEAWRLAVRGAFRTAFSVGFQVVGFLREQAEGTPRCAYLLERELSREEPDRGSL